jgi:hypothetical protein
MRNQTENTVAFNAAYEEIHELVSNFDKGRQKFLSSDYSEQQARLDFIDKFWTALGWDVNHKHQLNPYEQEVKVERSVDDQGRGRRADYAFLAPNFRDVRFFVEAKRPGAEIDSADNYFQIIRYGWNSHAPVSVLMSFAQFRVLDCRYKPDIDSAGQRVVSELRIDYSQFADQEVFSKIYYLFAHHAVTSGSLERYAESLPKPTGKAVQRGLFPSGHLQPMDESFLEELDGFRKSLAQSFKRKNLALDSDQLTEATQRTLDRLVFMRFLEDKLIEPDVIVEKLGDRGGVWEDFVAASHRLDRIYNGIIFRDHNILDSSHFRVEDNVFENIREKLAHTNSPYAFHYIPIHILGSIYERFLSKTIIATAKQARVEPKPENRKKHGVFYTPEYIVRYMVDETVGKIIADKHPQEIAKLRFADIACGSGSFLLSVYDALLRRHVTFYNQKTNRRIAREAGCVENPDDGTFHLSLRQKRSILLNNLYGVDIDPQAVEVAQLSLYLKLLEEETTASARHYQLEFGERLLPDLSKNIVCGNALVEWDILEGELFGAQEERHLRPFDFKTLFPAIMTQGGFDVIVGNPPYVQLSMKEFRDERVNRYLREKYGFSGGRLNTFAFFLERARQLTKVGGEITYIVPNTITTQEYYATLRQKLLYGTEIERITTPVSQVFHDAVVENVILIVTKRNGSGALHAGKVKFQILSEDGQVQTSAVADQTSLATNYKLSFVAPADPKMAALREKLNRQPLKFGDCTEINQAIALKHDRAACLVDTKKNNSYHEILDGRHIERYFTGTSPNFFKFDITKIHSCKREDIFLQPEKILFRRVGDRLIGTLDSDQKYALNTLVVISIRPQCKYDLRFILGIFNSTLLNSYYCKFLKSSKKVFSEIQAHQVEQLPVPELNLEKKADREDHDRLVSLVKKPISLAGQKDDRCTATNSVAWNRTRPRTRKSQMRYYRP